MQNTPGLKIYILFLLLAVSVSCFSQAQSKDSAIEDSLTRKTNLLLKHKEEQRLDSIIKQKLETELQEAEGDKRRTLELEKKLREISIADSIRKAEQIEQIAELKSHTNGFAVVPFIDTLFTVYVKIGSFSAKQRAEAITQRILNLYHDPFYISDSLQLNETENGFDILYSGEEVLMTVTDIDALWFNSNSKELANNYLLIIRQEIETQKEANSLKNWLRRIGLVALIIIGLTTLIYLINKLFRRIIPLTYKNKKWFNNELTIRKIKLLTTSQFRLVIQRINNILRILVIILVIYFSLPMLFSLFPETKAWTDTLLGWIMNPLNKIFHNILRYLPNLFTIIVIYLVFRYAIKAAKFFVTEIEHGRIVLKGFHADWAQPTFGIIKFLLYAFMLVLIFPYLPGSHSAAFQGVSVFVGVLLSLGSSSAISNMIAGLIITYMRPFKPGDRIKIGEITGDVIEKTILVTRIRTIKNEEITVPNSTVLSSNTINYSTNTRPEDTGLIMHTTVTIGYDVPWKDIQQALINAALKTEFILQTPQPFVLQTSLEDFYVAYQLNAYTKEPNKQATIYSQLHLNIQDCCNEMGIEIMSPHYRAVRDGNASTMPPPYLPDDYKTPPFNIKVENQKEGKINP